MVDNKLIDYSNWDLLFKDLKEDDVFLYDLDKEEDLQGDYRNSNYKYIKMVFSDEKNKYNILVKQDYKIGKGGIFWDGSFITSKIFLNSYLKDKSNLNILELGSGTSLPSIVSVLTGNHTVVTTDLDKTFDLRNQIIELNKKNFIGKISNLNLDWEKTDTWFKVEDYFSKKENDNCSVDYIICSELIYIDELFEPLISTLRNYCDKNTIILLTYRERLPSQISDFKEKFSEFFSYTNLDDNDLDKFAFKKKMNVLEAKLK